MDGLANVVLSIDTHLADFNYGSYIWRAVGAGASALPIFRSVEVLRRGDRVHAGMPLERVLTFECFVRSPFDGVIVDVGGAFIMRPSLSAWEQHLKESAMVAER